MLDTEKLYEALENTVDQSSLAEVLSGLADVCQLKADHLRANWQDDVTARNWELSGKLIAKIAAKINL